MRKLRVLATKGKKFSDLIIETIEKMKNDSDFKIFVKSLKRRHSQLKQLIHLPCSGNKKEQTT